MKHVLPQNKFQQYKCQIGRACSCQRVSQERDGSQFEVSNENERAHQLQQAGDQHIHQTFQESWRFEQGLHHSQGP